VGTALKRGKSQVLFVFRSHTTASEFFSFPLDWFAVWAYRSCQAQVIVMDGRATFENVPLANRLLMTCETVNSAGRNFDIGGRLPNKTGGCGSRPTR